MTIARIALAYWTAFLAFLCPIFHDNEYNIPSSILLEVFFPCLLKMQSLRQKANASTVILEAFLNADLLLFLVMTQLSAYISILIQCN